MEITNVQILTPKEGYYLTQANRMEDETPIMSKKVFNPRTSNDWKEITIEEGDRIVSEWQAEQELKMQQEMDNTIL